MTLLSPVDIASLRAVAELPFQDAYTLMRKPATAVVDSRGNRRNATGADFEAVETGLCRLRMQGLQPSERIVADRLGWSAPYAIDLPVTADAVPDDQLVVAGRTFHIGGVVREGELAMLATAVCEERSS